MQLNIRRNIEFLTKGCSCKRGCKTLNCGCRKRSQNCGPGCLCQGCTNVNIEQLPDDNSNSSSSSGSSDETDDEYTECEDGEQVEEEIITEDDFCFSTYDIV